MNVKRKLSPVLLLSLIITLPRPGQLVAAQAVTATSSSQAVAASITLSAEERRRYALTAVVITAWHRLSDGQQVEKLMQMSFALTSWRLDPGLLSGALNQRIAVAQSEFDQRINKASGLQTENERTPMDLAALWGSSALDAALGGDSPQSVGLYSKRFLDLVLGRFDDSSTTPTSPDQLVIPLEERLTYYTTLQNPLYADSSIESFVSVACDSSKPDRASIMAVWVRTWAGIDCSTPLAQIRARPPFADDSTLSFLVSGSGPLSLTEGDIERRTASVYQTIDAVSQQYLDSLGSDGSNQDVLASRSANVKPQAQPSPTPTQTPTTGLDNWKKKLSDTSAAISMLSEFVAPIDPKFARELSVAGHSSALVADAFGKLSTAITAINDIQKAGGILTEFGAFNTVIATGNLVGAAMAIFSLFSAGGTNPNQQTAQQLARISQQIDRLEREMNARFDRIDSKLNAIYTEMEKFFIRTDFYLGKMQDDLNTIQDHLFAVESNLYRMESNLDDYEQELSSEDFGQEVALSLGFRDTYGDDLPYDTGDPSYAKSESTFSRWAAVVARDPIETGGQTHSMNPEDILYELTAGSGNDTDLYRLERNINFLSDLLPTLGLPSLVPANAKRLVNPRIWAEAANAYVELATEWPQYDRRVEDDPTTRPHYYQMLSAGKEIQTALQSIASTPTIYDRLIANYRQQFDRLITDIQNVEKGTIANPDYHIPSSVDIWGAEDQPAPHPSVPVQGCDGEQFNLPAPESPRSIFDDMTRFVLAQALGKGKITLCVEPIVSRGEPVRVRLVARYNDRVVVERVATVRGVDGPLYGLDETHAYMFISACWVVCHPCSFPCDVSVQPLLATPGDYDTVWPADYGDSIGKVTADISQKFRETQAAVYRAVAQALASGSLVTDGKIVGGARALLDAFIILGLPHASEIDDYLRSLMFGNQRLYDWDSIGAAYSAAASSPRWTAKAPMPTARSSLATVTGADGRIYALGGHNDTSGDLHTVEAYDPSSNAWSTVAPMPTAREGLAAALGKDGRIYAIGGWHNGALSTVEAYDPATRSWTTRAPMPTARWELAAVTGGDGRIYAIGGYSSTSANLNTVEAYDPATNTWSTRAAMPTARHDLAAVTGADGQIYAIGGDVGVASTGASLCYQAYMQDLAWMNEVCNGDTAGTPNQALRMQAFRVHLVGGPPGVSICYQAYMQDLAWMNEVCNGDTAGTPYQALRMQAFRVHLVGAPPGTSVCYQAYMQDLAWMNEVCNGETAGTPNQALRVQAFRIHIQNRPVPVSTVEAYNPATNTWSARTAMPTARKGLTAATAPDGWIYAIGGDNGSAFSMAEAYNPSTDTWTTVEPMPTARSGAGAVSASDGHIYVIGGGSNSGAVDAVEAYAGPSGNLRSFLGTVEQHQLGDLQSLLHAYVGEIQAGKLVETQPMLQVTLDRLEAYKALRDQPLLQADLAVQLTGPPQARVGSLAKYVATINNRGPDPTNGVLVRFVVPARMSFVSASSSRGTCTPTSPPLGSDNVVTCDVGTLSAAGAGSSASVAIVLSPTATGITDSSVHVSGDELDPVTPNNRARVRTTLLPPVPIATTLTVQPVTAGFHEMKTLSATLTNASSHQGIAGQQLIISAGALSCQTGASTSTGVGSCSLFVASVPGIYPLKASYAGNGEGLQPAISTVSRFTVTPGRSSIAYSGPTVLANQVPVQLVAGLTDAVGKAIVGATLTFTLGTGITARKCTAVTSAPAGSAACSLTPTQPALGNLPLTISFGGSTLFRPSQRVQSVLLTRAVSLTVSKSGTGGGTVTSAPAGITYGTSCTARYPSGTKVTLRAQADPTSTFTRWSGACTGQTPSCTLTMDAAKSVTVTFAATSTTAVIPATATALAGSSTWISVQSPFQGDANNNSSTTYEYSTAPSGPWTPACGNGIPGESAWRICTITGLTANTDYWVRVTFVDPDGVNGPNPQILGPVHTQAAATSGVTVGTASAGVQDTGILVTMPISGDANTNSRLIVKVGPSSNGPWTQKCGDDGFYSPKLCRVDGLVQNTEYWVQASVSDPDGVSGTNPQVLGPLHYTGLTDLALGKAISADPGWGCCPDPNQLVDGIVQSPSWTYGFAWTGGTGNWGGGAPGWKQATIDLGSAQQVARLDFWPHHPGHVVTDWKVLVSQDGVSFTEVFSTTQPQCRTATVMLQTDWGYPACAQTARFAPVSARYVRYTFDDRTTFGGLHGWGQEIEVFG